MENIRFLIAKRLIFGKDVLYDIFIFHVNDSFTTDLSEKLYLLIFIGCNNLKMFKKPYPFDIYTVSRVILISKVRNNFHEKHLENCKFLETLEVAVTVQSSK